MHASITPSLSPDQVVPVRPVPSTPRLRVTHARRRATGGERLQPAPLRVVAPAQAAGTARHVATMMDRTAYDLAVRAHSNALLRYVVKHLRDRDEAKDIVQEVFLRVWTRLDQVPVQGLRSYLFTAAHNPIVDRTRRRKYLLRYEPGHYNVLTTRQPKAGLGDALDEALARLSPLHGSLILLRDRDGHSYNDIAEITGLDLTKVKVYIHRARKAMQARLGSLDQWV